jgi:CheY-like chemotaxis protein/HPt (histidine-containing phosphotransfer) domain-containing protein
MVASELLAQAGFACETASDGAKALERVQQSHFNLVLMDCQMPHMDGFEATRRIRECETRGPLPGRSTRLPIVALTANALKGDRERCLEAGMDDYLTKPLQPETLMQTIRKHLSPNPTEPVPALPAPNEPTTSANESRPLDWEPLLRRCCGRDEFARQILAKFREQSVQILDTLVQGCQQRDGELATRSAHSLKGMAATVSAEPLRQAAARAEAVSRAGDWDAVEQHLNGLRRELEECLAFAAQLSSGASATSKVEKSP